VRKFFIFLPLRQLGLSVQFFVRFFSLPYIVRGVTFFAAGGHSGDINIFTCWKSQLFMPVVSGNRSLVFNFSWPAPKLLPPSRLGFSFSSPDEDCLWRLRNLAISRAWGEGSAEAWRLGFAMFPQTGEDDPADLGRRPQLSCFPDNWHFRETSKHGRGTRHIHPGVRRPEREVIEGPATFQLHGPAPG